jgi:hypothetical protein
VSASEKLKDWDARLNVDDIPTWEGEMINFAEAMAEALPQIVAVVGAAERSHDHRQAMVGGTCETCAALSALEEALTSGAVFPWEPPPEC